MARSPLGIMPRRLHDRQRTLDLLDAIMRYHEAGQIPKNEWLEEVKDYVQRYC